VSIPPTRPTCRSGEMRVWKRSDAVFFSGSPTPYECILRHSCSVRHIVAGIMLLACLGYRGVLRKIFVLQPKQLLCMRKRRCRGLAVTLRWLVIHTSAVIIRQVSSDSLVRIMGVRRCRTRGNMSGDDSSLSLRAPARETVFRPFPLASPSGALYIERMFFLRRCIKNQFTIFVSIDPYIPTGYGPGLDALPVRNLSIIEPADICTRLASAPHPCTLVFKPQPFEPRRVATTMPTTRPAVNDLHNAVTTARGERHAIIPYPLRGRD